MQDLKISQFNTAEKWGHQEMHWDTMSRDMNYGEPSLAFSVIDSTTCLCSDSKCQRLQMQKSETSPDLLANSMETSFLLDLI